MNYEFEGDHHSNRNIIDDPWYGRCHTDVTECHYRLVPSHCSQDMNSPVPSFDRRATDVTQQLHSRPSSPILDNVNYGKVNTDVTQHLHLRAPKFVDPHGAELEPYFGVQGTDITNYKICPIQSIQVPTLTEFMRPLGKHRPFPLSQMFFHDGSKPRSRSASPYRSYNQASPRQQPRHQCPPPGSYNQASPAKQPRQQFPPRESRSPSRELPSTDIPGPPPLSRNRSKSPSKSRHDRSRSPIEGKQSDSPTSRSPTKSQESRHRSRSRQRSPPPLSLQQHIPSRFLNCSLGCELCPPCPACKELLDSGYGREFSNGASSTHCQFHGNSPCPVQSGFPCYGMRPWGPPQQ